MIAKIYLIWYCKNTDNKLELIRLELNLYDEKKSYQNQYKDDVG